MATDLGTLRELRKELYKGSWKLMLQDLRERLRAKPYNFRLSLRIQEDIRRIETEMKMAK